MSLTSIHIDDPPTPPPPPPLTIDVVDNTLKASTSWSGRFDGGGGHGSCHENISLGNRNDRCSSNISSTRGVNNGGGIDEIDVISRVDETTPITTEKNGARIRTSSLRTKFRLVDNGRRFILAIRRSGGQPSTSSTSTTNRYGRTGKRRRSSCLTSSGSIDSFSGIGTPAGTGGIIRGGSRGVGTGIEVELDTICGVGGRVSCRTGSGVTLASSSFRGSRGQVGGGACGVTFDEARINRIQRERDREHRVIFYVIATFLFALVLFGIIFIVKIYFDWLEFHSSIPTLVSKQLSATNASTSTKTTTLFFHQRYRNNGFIGSRRTDDNSTTPVVVVGTTPIQAGGDWNGYYQTDSSSSRVKPCQADVTEWWNKIPQLIENLQNCSYYDLIKSTTIDVQKVKF